MAALKERSAQSSLNWAIPANELFTLFRVWLRLQFEQLGCNDDSDELAMHLFALSQGVAILYSAFQDDKIIHDEVSRLDDWLAVVATGTNTKSEVV